MSATVSKDTLVYCATKLWDNLVHREPAKEELVSWTQLLENTAVCVIPPATQDLFVSKNCVSQNVKTEEFVTRMIMETIFVDVLQSIKEEVAVNQVILMLI